jgi:hypothetical protein
MENQKKEQNPPQVLHLDLGKLQAEPLERKKNLAFALYQNMNELLTFSRITQVVASCGIIGWVFKSRWVKKVIVKRYIVQPKKFNLEDTTKLGLIKRPDIFKIWDKRVDEVLAVKPFILVEGYQGTGKSFLAKKYIEEQSLKRPTLYISLREIETDDWKETLAKQIHLYRDHMFVKSHGTLYNVDIIIIKILRSIRLLYGMFHFKL